MSDFEYEYQLLWQLIQDNTSQIEKILEEYIALLSELSVAPLLSKEEFINNLSQIKNMGFIYVCYYKTVENSIHIVGSGTIIFEPKIIRNGKCVGHIEDIIVGKKHTSKGIAKKIIDKLMCLADEKGCYKVILDCKSELSTFYEKFGFEKHGIQMSKYNFKTNNES
jgi:glucosamine-phosphate N-acetyltransferase